MNFRKVQILVCVFQKNVHVGLQGTGLLACHVPNSKAFCLSIAKQHVWQEDRFHQGAAVRQRLFTVTCLTSYEEGLLSRRGALELLTP